MLCAIIPPVVGLAIVVHIVAQVCHRVVGSVATYRTSKMQLFSQTVLLDKAVGGQCHRAALRVTYAYALPIVSKFDEGGILLKEFQSGAHAIHHLTGGQFLVEVGVGTILAHAVALVVGHDNQTAGVAHAIVARVVNQHAYVGHPRKPTATLVVFRGALVVTGDGDVAADDQVFGDGRSALWYGHQRRQGHLIAVGIHRRIGIGVEFGVDEVCAALILQLAGTPAGQCWLRVFVGTDHDDAFIGKVGIVDGCNLHVVDIHRLQ